MKNSWIGILLIIVGTMFLLHSLEIMEFGNIIKKFWPVAFILIGIIILVKSRKSK